MTIASCYVSSEGVVFGADSTSSIVFSSGLHYLNHNQKIFEIGKDSTLGLLTWGLGGLGTLSYRTLVAQFDDAIKEQALEDVETIAKLWVDTFWEAYNSFSLVQKCKALKLKKPFNPNTKEVSADERTEVEEKEFHSLKSVLVVGFCIGGHLPSNRTPMAYEILFDPIADKPRPKIISCNNCKFWGAPNFILRLLNGYDPSLPNNIMKSGKWAGNVEELYTLLNQNILAHPSLPIRDAIDFVHISIYSTIKAMKFSNLSQICGGPVELAVITSDRNFRWVWHKDWDAAIMESNHK